MKSLVSWFAAVAMVLGMTTQGLAQKAATEKSEKPAAKAKAENAKAESSKAANAKADGAKQEAAKPAEGKKRAAVASPLLKAVDGLTLTAAQKPKVEEAAQEFTETILALRKEGLTQELVKKKNMAAKEAREAGKKGRELEAAVAAALDATDEQKSLLKKAEEANAKLVKAISAILTADQIATLPPQMQQTLGARKAAETKAAPKKAA